MKKRNLFYILLLAVLILSFVLTGCNSGTNDGGNDGNGGGGNDTPTPTYYTVMFDSMGGSETPSQSVLAGNTVRRPQTPTREGYFLIGWFRDSAATDEWSFDTDRITADITLYAGWQQVSSPDVEPQPTASLVFEREGDTYTVTDVGEETVVVIPSTYEGLPVTKIQGAYGTGAFARKAITEITIPDSIMEIGQNTFNNCSDLVTVNIGENSALTTIGNNAFSGNASLTSIYLPSGVTSIGNSAFNNCGALETITVAESNTAYTSNGNALIERATNTLIRGTNNTVIPDGVAIIAQAAFRRSTIAQINIPSSVIEIGDYAFDDCENLLAITVDSDNTAFASQDGVLYNKDMTALIETPEGITGEITLPSTLTEIPQYAFDGRGITSVTITRGALTNIAFGAFRNTTLTIRYEGTEDEWNAITKHSSWGGAALTVLFGITVNPDDNPDESANGVLVVYFSCTNRTQGVGQYIAAASGGTLIEIMPEVAYTAEDLNYNNSSSRSQTERRDDARPAISNATYDSIDMSKYSTVFIGYPIWNGYEPMIIRSFIEHYEGLSGKTVYTFSTSASSGGGTAHGSVSGRCQNAAVGNNLHLTSSTLSDAETRVNRWIDGLGLGVLSFVECAVATSGNYQRYFGDEAGNRYGYIMDPAMGRPQESELLSVTVVAKDGKLCEALATAIYVMGKDAAIELWRKETSFEPLLITGDGTAYGTEVRRSTHG